jgi:predicted GNAT family N-acyltransferase
MKITNNNLVFTALTDSDDLSHFICSDDDLNEFLKIDALPNQKTLLSVTRLAYREKKLIAYFSLTNDSIRKKHIQPDDGEPDYPYSHYPALKIARLAVHQEHEGKGIGTAMLVECVATAFIIAEYSGCRIITVDAKENSTGFYERYGFKKVNMETGFETITMYVDLNKLT